MQVRDAQDPRCHAVVVFQYSKRSPNLVVLLVSASLLAAGAITVAPVARAACPGAAQPPDDGAGTYLVSSVAHLEWIRDANENGTDDQLGYNYRQTGDIDFDGCEWTRSIGDGATDFTGSYDGDGHSITNFSLESAETFAGLFGDVNGATLTQIVISGTVRTRNPGTLAYAGVLAGRIQGGTVTEIGTGGSAIAVQGGFFSTYAGGIVGFSTSSIDNSYSRASAISRQTGTGSAYAGGIAGQGGQSTKRVLATGSLTGKGNDVAGVTSRSFNRTIDGYGFCLASSSSQCVGNDGLQDNTSRLDSDALTNASTYTDEGWDLTNGFSSDTVWSICSNINDGYPFLSVEYDDSPCVPGLATDLAGTPGDGQVRVNWTASPSNGEAVTGYKVEYSDDDGDSWTVAQADTGSDATTVNVGDLANGTAYRFRVSGINGNGTGDPSAASATITPRSSGGDSSGGGGAPSTPAPTGGPTPSPTTPTTPASSESLLLDPDGGPVVVAAGRAAAYSGNSELPTPEVIQDGSLWTAAGSGYALQVLGPQPSGMQERSTTAVMIPAVTDGQTVAVAARGFAPGETVRGWVISSASPPTEEPSVAWEVDATGSATGVLLVDVQVPGSHTLQVRGPTSSGSVLSVLFGLTVEPRSSTSRFAIRFRADRDVLTKRSRGTLDAVLGEGKGSSSNVTVTLRRLRADGSAGRQLARERKRELRKELISLGVPRSNIDISIKGVKKLRFAKRSIVDVRIS